MHGWHEIFADAGVLATTLQEQKTASRHPARVFFRRSGDSLKAMQTEVMEDHAWGFLVHGTVWQPSSKGLVKRR